MVKVALAVAALAVYPPVAVAVAIVVVVVVIMPAAVAVAVVVALVAAAVAVVAVVVRRTQRKPSCTCRHQAGSQHLWEARSAPQTRNRYTRRGIRAFVCVGWTGQLGSH